MIGHKLNDILKNVRNVCRNVFNVACKSAIKRIQTSTNSAIAAKFTKFKYSEFSPRVGKNSIIWGKYFTEKS